MKLVVGLGNPGPEYAATRHNIGFLVAQKFAQQMGVSLKRQAYQGIVGTGRADGQETMVLLPQTYMNRSGVSVVSACKSKGIAVEDVVVIHDEIDLPFGSIRIKVGGGHGGHNGLRSIVDLLGCRDFLRVRMGVGRPQGQVDVAKYVLGQFSSTEKSQLDNVLENSVKALEVLLQKGAQQAMNEFNNRVFLI
ncbi:peptidyl-tRNA hydrolase [Syntrophotalea carbinolica DSM 2380]|uniref:Peptidyl-tRNA hydrolase n=1 Tax=Syntrophotalea carbinolica (strain DSM 2380 / NBRC 103641 / GraBd1) TaxID=338963 RepID=PTH_SYNC1|nr:RecName: Full=Peptidyl-tRNA hydrolase; Short=PTH [Syntrophotalea carbinolica DSM 2380]ABA89243.1 peptidyl-tRNA hydrolase [Syntrophotalea carbinolica DSM 2380]